MNVEARRKFGLEAVNQLIPNAVDELISLSSDEDEIVQVNPVWSLDILKDKKSFLIVSLILVLSQLIVGCSSTEATISSSNSLEGSTGSAKVSSPSAQSTTGTITTTPQLQTPGIFNDWQNRWLRGIPCKAPCWEGITPGMTTGKEALQHLQESPIVAKENAKLWNSEPGANYGSLAWDWATEDKDKIKNIGHGGFAFFKPTSDQLIFHIEPKMLSYNIKLKQVISVYGEPTYAAMTDETIPEGSPYTYIVRFVYLEQGFFVEGVFPQLPKPNPDIVLSNVEFFVPNFDGFKAIIYPSKRTLVKWVGYKPFDFYCRNLTEGGTSECPGIKTRITTP